MSHEPEFPDDSLPDEPSVHERVREYAGVLWKHRRLIILCVTVAVIAGALYAVLSEPTFLAVTARPFSRASSSSYFTKPLRERLTVAGAFEPGHWSTWR